MSEAFNVATRASCNSEDIGECWYPQCIGSCEFCDRYPTLLHTALRAFLDAVANSQQPVSHNAMRTLRLHLELETKDAGRGAVIEECARLCLDAAREGPMNIGPGARAWYAARSSAFRHAASMILALLETKDE